MAHPGRAARCNVPARRSTNQRTAPASCFPADFPGTCNKGRKAKSSGMLRPSETELLRVGQASFRCTVRASDRVPSASPSPDLGVQCQSVRKSSAPPPLSLPSPSVAKTSRYTKVHSKQMQKRSHMRARPNIIKPVFRLSSGPSRPAAMPLP